MEARPIDGKHLKYVLVTPDGAQPDGTWPIVVILHGLSGNMYDLTGLTQVIDPEGYVYAFPQAPYDIPFKENYFGHSWMPDRPGVLRPPADLPPVDQLLDGFMDELLVASRTPAGKVVIAGFSQGGGIALRFALPRPHVFAGAICLSGAIHDVEALRALLPAPEERKMPVFMSHGRYDTYRRFERTDESRRFLVEQGYAPDYGEYNMGHEISDALCRDLKRWLHLRLPPHEPVPQTTATDAQQGQEGP